jgi:hypothetical protein
MLSFHVPIVLSAPKAATVVIAKTRNVLSGNIRIVNLLIQSAELRCLKTSCAGPVSLLAGRESSIYDDR